MNWQSLKRWLNRQREAVLEFSHANQGVIPFPD